MRDEKSRERSRVNGTALALLLSMVYPNHIFYYEEVYW
jgi:hypothetical protein